MYHLDRLFILSSKGRAQTCMSSHKLFHTLLQRLYKDTSVYVQREENVISSRARFELIQKPEPLLRKREWEDLRRIELLSQHLRQQRTFLFRRELIKLFRWKIHHLYLPFSHTFTKEHIYFLVGKRREIC